MTHPQAKNAGASASGQKGMRLQLWPEGDGGLSPPNRPQVRPRQPLT